MAQSKPDKISREEVAERLAEATDEESEEIKQAAEEFEIEDPEEAEWEYTE